MKPWHYDATKRKPYHLVELSRQMVIRRQREKDRQSAERRAIKAASSPK